MIVDPLTKFQIDNGIPTDRIGDRQTFELLERKFGEQVWTGKWRLHERNP